MVLIGQRGPVEETGKGSSDTIVQVAGFWRHLYQHRGVCIVSNLPHLLSAVASTIPFILESLM